MSFIVIYCTKDSRTLLVTTSTFLPTPPEFKCSLIKVACKCCFYYISLSVKNGFNFAKCFLLEIVCRKNNFPTVSSAFAEAAVLITIIPQCVTRITVGL